MKFQKDVVIFDIGGISIIGNTQNGGFAGLSIDGKEFVEKIIEENPISQELLNANRELMEYLVEEDYFTNKVSGSVGAAYLHLTNNCPLHCIGCYSDDDDRNKKIDLNTSDIFHEIDELKEIGVDTIIISGGEPLLRRDIIEIVKYAKNEKKIGSLVLLTSGMILNKQLSDDLAKYVDVLSISIDGFSEEIPTFLRDKGIFKRILRSIDIAKESNFKKLSILPTLHNKNIQYISNYIDFSKKYEVDLSFSILTVPPTDVLADWMLNETQLRYLGSNSTHIGEEISAGLQPLGIDDFEISTCKKCGIGEDILSIGADGTVYPCHMAHNSKLALGNVHEEPLTVIEKRAKKIYSQLNVDRLDSDSCKNCKYKYMCGGGCRARAFMINENILDKDPYCPMFKTFYNLYEEQIEKINL